MKKNDRIRLCLVGCGRISTRHIESLAPITNLVELVALCDLVEEKARAAAKKYASLAGIENSPEVFTDAAKMIKTLKPDMVTISTDSGTHARIGLAALDAGCHALIEKPMALHMDDARALVDRAKAKKLTLGVCYQNRFNAPVQRLREAIDSGRFGKLLYGVASIRWNRDNAYYRQDPWRGTWKLDGGALMNQCTHCIDLLRWTMGPEVEEVYGSIERFLRPIEAEDFGAGIVKFRGGTTGLIEGTSCVFPKNLEESLSIFGERGTVRITGVALERIDVWRFADGLDSEADVLRDQVDEPPPTVYGFGHGALYRDFVDAVKKGRQPLAAGIDGMLSLQLNLSIYKSAMEGKNIRMPLGSFGTADMEGWNT